MSSPHPPVKCFWSNVLALGGFWEKCRSHKQKGSTLSSHHLFSNFVLLFLLTTVGSSLDEQGDLRLKNKAVCLLANWILYPFCFESRMKIMCVKLVYHMKMKPLATEEWMPHSFPSSGGDDRDFQRTPLLPEDQNGVNVKWRSPHYPIQARVWGRGRLHWLAITLKANVAQFTVYG